MNDAIDVVIAMCEETVCEYNQLPEHSNLREAAQIRINALCDVLIALRRAMAKDGK